MVSGTDELRLADVLDVEVVRLEDERLDIGELILLGLLTGTWRPFEQDVAHGLALEQLGHNIEHEKVSARATAFRYRQKLVSAADFTSWLRAHSLSLEDLSGVLRRALLREAASDENTEQAVTINELSSVLYAEAICGGVLEDLAAAGGERLAAAHRLGAFPIGTDADPTEVAALVKEAQAHPATLPALDQSALAARAQRVIALEHALARTRSELARDERSLHRRLTDHALDWIRLSGSELLLGFAGAARESRLLVTEDNLSLDDVAALARTEASPRTFYLEEIPAEVRGQLASLRVGELAEPWEAEGGWHVFELHAKVAPSLQDPGLRERVLDELLVDTLRRHAAGRVERSDGV